MSAALSVGNADGLTAAEAEMGEVERRVRSVRSQRRGMLKPLLGPAVAEAASSSSLAGERGSGEERSESLASRPMRTMLSITIVAQWPQ